jgi:hypothetical protein
LYSLGYQEEWLIIRVEIGRVKKKSVKTVPPGKLGGVPRIRDPKDQQLYKIERGRSYGLDPLFRSAIDTALIQTQWDALVREAASLRNRTAPAHVVVQRLAGGSSADRLAKARRGSAGW